MNFLLSTLKGFLIGAGAILPGISSGVLCVIFGIYETLVDSVLGLFQDFKKHATFLFPIVLGSTIGFLLFGNLLNFLFHSYETECKLLFLGLILGSIPSLFKHINKKKNFRLSFLIYTIISFCFGLLLFLLENKISNSYLGNLQVNVPFLFLSGFAMSAGVIIPGISSTVILMCFRDLLSLFRINFYVEFVCFNSNGNRSFLWKYFLSNFNSIFAKKLSLSDLLCYYWLCFG